MSTATPRAPAARAKLEQAETVQADLEREVFALALEASEGKAGAEKALAAHRAKIDGAERQVAELRGAVALAEFLDKEAAVAALARMRAAQLVSFKAAMEARTKAMAAVLEAAAAMAKAYGEYSEATQAAVTVVPSGTTVPVMTIGPNGVYGNAWGPAGQMILAELYRLATPRIIGDEHTGYFVLPFAKVPNLSASRDTMPAGIDEFRAADQAIIREIEQQLAALNERAQAAITARKKEAA